jgi:hypothetical protein
VRAASVEQIEPTGMPLDAVEQAFADGQAREGICDLAGSVVYLLRQRRDSGWAPAPPERPLDDI